MKFTGKELAAMTRMAVSMAIADNNFAKEETVAIALNLAKFGLSEDQAQSCLERAQTMESGEAIATLSSMSTTQKKYATGFLAVVMAADRDITDSEVSMWKLISSLAEFPIMTIGEALDFWRNN
jgi:uncharacterized tellurite resistance protein B-like protein